jgi:hypothetical protein
MPVEFNRGSQIHFLDDGNIGAVKKLCARRINTGVPEKPAGGVTSRRGVNPPYKSLHSCAVFPHLII